MIHGAREIMANSSQGDWFVLWGNSSAPYWPVLKKLISTSPEDPTYRVLKYFPYSGKAYSLSVHELRTDRRNNYFERFRKSHGLHPTNRALQGNKLWFVDYTITASGILDTIKCMIQEARKLRLKPIEAGIFSLSDIRSPHRDEEGLCASSDYYFYPGRENPYLIVPRVVITVKGQEILNANTHRFISEGYPYLWNSEYEDRKFNFMQDHSKAPSYMKTMIEYLNVQIEKYLSEEA
ncbi:MAG: hypothetical protein GY915_01525 [bacterium]|nr:hypothetical protein [bacterium]